MQTKNKKNQKFHQNLLAFVQKNRFIITFVVITLITFIIVFLPLIIYKSFFSSKTLELSVLISQIISAIFVIAGVIVGVWQYYISARGFTINLERNRIEKAIKLSEYYKDNVLHLYSAVRFVFETSGVLSLLSEAKTREMCLFNKNEIYKVLEEKKYKELKKMNTSNQFTQYIILANDIYGLDLKMDSMDSSAQKGKQNQLILNSFLSDVISRVLNNLEYFSFNFTHNIADESVIYQSIAPTYIDLVELLYFRIAEVNDTNSANTFYTNVIELYSIWKAKQNNQQIEIDNAQNRNVVDKGSVL
mgnify:FL=1